ncbi:glycosyl hydrolase family 17 protein [Thalassospiraceae bacterium LMO-SO8]|nr:glycosyl hydrolase family 17 protein [Alphaproteobacteria bacterium LMO-S08]WND75328.1 glycosyl hydrolase family 17 protein [Thalassospiraceae bacterium LMO-SO8]
MRWFLISLGVFAAVASAVTALWAWLGRPVDMVDAPGGRFQCLSYAPTTADGHPLMGPDYDLPPGLIERDLEALSKLTGCVRTYSSYGVQAGVLPAAAKLGMKVLLGIWIGAEDKQNQIEIAAALRVAARHPEAVRAIVVGNEVLLRREMTGKRLAGIIRSVKARTMLPVAYADVFDFWERHPAVAEAVDLMLIHVLPYWDDPAPRSVRAAQDGVRATVAHARAVFPHARIEIGETGWPSAGRTRGAGVPSRVNQARFLREFAAQAQTLGVPYNVVEAVDQPWKRAPEGTVGGFWGVFDADRAAKFPLAGPVREWPDWPLAAGFSAALCLLFLTGLFVAGQRLRPAAILGVGLAGGATGTCLWMLAAQVEAAAIGTLGWLGGIYLLLLAAGGGVLLAALLARLPVLDGLRSAPLGEVLEGLAGCRLSQDQALGLIRWAVLLPAGVLALALAADGRHRDFVPLAFVLPGLALALLAWRARGMQAARPEEAWIALLLAVAGPLAVDAPGNLEALAWAGTCLLLALPGLPGVAGELRFLGRALAAQGQGN